MHDSGEHDVNNEIRPVVVVIGNFTHEGLTAKIESLGFEVINRNLRSTTRNWTRIIDLLHGLSATGQLAAVFLYVPTTTLLQMAEPLYDEVRLQLLDEIEKVTSIVFVHEDNLQGTIEPFPWEVHDPNEEDRAELDIPWATFEDATYRAFPTGNSDLPTSEQWKLEHADAVCRGIELLAAISSRKIEVAPFRKRSDVTIRMFEVLEETQAGIFLRLYVPHGRYQSEQFEDFLTLFARYLRDVEKKEFSVDVHRTSRGTTFVFKGQGDASTVEDLQAATKRFDEFLSLAQVEPESAALALEKAGVESAAAAFIVAKYARSIRRLHMETKHEFERRKLLLSQSLDSDLLDSSETQILPMPSPTHPSSLFAVVGNTAPVTISLSSTQLSAAGSMQIERLISGGTLYTNEDKEILALIEGLTDKVEALKLRSELDRLKDPATAPEERRTAVQKLKSLVYKSSKYVGKKIDEIGTKLLIAYLEKVLTGGASSE